MELMEHIKDETMVLIVPRGTLEQIEALAAARAGTEDQIADQLIHLGLEAYRAGELGIVDTR
jgi:NaMN:DMB phosphoribosyltransferase